MQSGDFKLSWKSWEGEFGELLLPNFLHEVALACRHRWNQSFKSLLLANNLEIFIFRSFGYETSQMTTINN